MQLIIQTKQQQRAIVHKKEKKCFDRIYKNGRWCLGKFSLQLEERTKADIMANIWRAL